MKHFYFVCFCFSIYTDFELVCRDAGTPNRTYTRCFEVAWASSATINLCKSSIKWSLVQESKSGRDNLHVGRNPQRLALCLSHSPWGHSLLTHTCMHMHLCTQATIFFLFFYPHPPSWRRGRSLSSSVLLIDEARAEGCLGEAGPDQGCGLHHHVHTFAYILLRLCRLQWWSQQSPQSQDASKSHTGRDVTGTAAVSHDVKSRKCTVTHAHSWNELAQFDCMGV